MRDYEKFRRQRSFRDAEMKQLKSSFARVLGLMKNGAPDLDFDIRTQRLTEEKYREWVIAMNTYNQQKGRWVDERSFTAESQTETEEQYDERTGTKTQYFYKSDTQKEEDAKKQEEEKKAEEAKDDDVKAPQDEAPWNWPECNLWNIVQEQENTTGHETRRRDFIGRMYDIHNHQSRVDLVEDGAIAYSVPGIPKEVPFTEGVSLYDFFQTNKEWSVLFTQLKDADEL